MSSVRLAAAVFAAVVVSGCTDDPTPLTNGYIKLKFVRGESQANDPYVSTARAIVSMDYETCLRDYYDANPDAQQGGPDGDLVFGTHEDGGEAWRDRLCEDLERSQADCSIIDINQELSMGTPHLTVEYAVQGTLEGRVLLFGPLPTGVTADCQDPTVRVSPQLPTGYNGQDDQIWIAENISPISALTNQGGEVVIKAKTN
ncbi:MAG: hypothetical protein U0168_15115 [Nannocystaceae bacterium]